MWHSNNVSKVFKYCMYIHPTITYICLWKLSGQLNHVPCNLGMQSLLSSQSRPRLLLSLSLGHSGLLATSELLASLSQPHSAHHDASFLSPEPNLRLFLPRPFQAASCSSPRLRVKFNPYFWPNRASSLSRSTCGTRCSYHMAARIGAQTRAPWPGTGSSSCDTSEIYDHAA